MNKLLCVDDEPFILQALDRLFKDTFTVLTAESGSEGLEILRREKDCAIIISDYRMPEMNGVDFLKQARLICPLASRAILSVHIDLQQISMALNHADIHKFILKPWENEYLHVQILESLQMHQTLSEKAHYQRLAITDPVTQLTNHRFFQDQLREEMKKSEESGAPLSLVIFDVDHFKSFNDRFGHPEGDRLLFNVATALKGACDRHGYVSRYGGEEFTLILPGFDAKRALQLSEDIRYIFERTSIAGPSSSPAYITLSAGITCFPEHGRTAPELIDGADRALYQAKRQGRNQVVIAGLGSR